MASDHGPRPKTGRTTRDPQQIPPTHADLPNAEGPLRTRGTRNLVGGRGHHAVMPIADVVLFDWSASAIEAVSDIRSAKRIAGVLPLLLVPLLSYALNWPRRLSRGLLAVVGAVIVLAAVQHAQWSLDQIPERQAAAQAENAQLLQEAFGISVDPESTQCLQTLAKYSAGRCSIDGADGVTKYLFVTDGEALVLAETS